MMGDSTLLRHLWCLYMKVRPLYRALEGTEAKSLPRLLHYSHAGKYRLEHIPIGDFLYVIRAGSAIALTRTLVVMV